MYSTAIELLSKKSDKLFCMFIALKNLGKDLEEQVNIQAKKNKNIHIQKKDDGDNLKNRSSCLLEVICKKCAQKCFAYINRKTPVSAFLQTKPLAEVLRFYSKETPAHTKDVFKTHLNIYNRTFMRKYRRNN